MSTAQAPQRPVFNSIDPSLENDLAPPISVLAIIGMLLGAFSLLSAISPSILPFSVLVALLCGVLTLKLAWDKSVGGLRLAQIGLFLAIVGIAWGMSATQITESYFYAQGAQHAKLFLDTLSAGKKFEAFELTLDESGRQVTGTDLNTHYEGLLKASLPKRTEASLREDMPSPETMKSSQSKEVLEEFLKNPSTTEIIGHGKDAKWEFVRGGGVKRMSNTQNTISVVMVDRANPSKKYQVDLNRVTGGYIIEEGKPPVAMWDIERTKVVKE